MPKVSIQGFGDVNFPDTMTPDQIQSAIETDILPKMQGAQPPQSPPNLTPPQPASIWSSQGLVDRLAPVLGPALEKFVGPNPQGSPVGRLVQGAADPMIGMTQMAAHVLRQGDAADQRIQSLEGQYQEQRKEAGSTGFDPLRMAGNISTMALAPGATAEATGPMWAQMLRGGATGALANMAQPVTSGDFGAEKGKQAMIGAGFGAAAVPIASGIARIVQPNTGANQKTLIDAGMTLTPGQTLGGPFQRVEDSMTSWPVVGDFIRDAKNRTLEGLSQGAYSRALEPANEVRQAIGLPAVSPSSLPAGPEGVLGVKTALGDAYNALLPKLTFDVRTITPELAQLRQMSASLPAKEASEFNAILDKNLGQLSNGLADGKTFKNITSNIGEAADNFGGSTDGYQRNLGAALTQAQALFKQGLAASNPQYSGLLSKLDYGYANYAVIRQAAQTAGDKSHGFTPAQLAAAVRANDDTVGNGATATGKALMQDLSDSARAVLPSTVADSGTPLRHAVQLAVGGVVGHSMLPEQASHLVIPAAIAGTAASLPYTGLGQKAVQAILAERPDWAPQLAALLRRAGPLAGTMAGASALPALPQGS